MKLERRDAVVTLSRDPKTRSSSIREEGAFLKEQGKLRYPLHHGKPKHPIRQLYFVRDDLVAAWAECIAVKREHYEVTYQGVELEKSNYRAIVKAPYALRKAAVTLERLSGVPIREGPEEIQEGI